MEYRIRLDFAERVSGLRFRRLGVSGSIVLVFAVSGSLAVGVLAAYGVCLMMFTLFRMHAHTLTTAKPVVKATPQIV